jgi:hypothetical protein
MGGLLGLPCSAQVAYSGSARQPMSSLLHESRLQPPLALAPSQVGAGADSSSGGLMDMGPGQAWRGMAAAHVRPTVTGGRSLVSAAATAFFFFYYLKVRARHPAWEHAGAYAGKRTLLGHRGEAVEGAGPKHGILT